MKQLVSVNLTTRTAKDWTPPVLTYGESLTLALRLYKNSAGSEIEAGLTINTLKASIGRVDERPAGGTFVLKVGADARSGANTTEAMDFGISASQLAQKLNGLAVAATYGQARVVWTDGSWLIFFGAQSAQVPLTVLDNGVWPVSLGRINAWQVDGKWVHELRLTQAPVAFTSSHDIVLPPAPTMTRIQAGGTDGVEQWNEIQQLYFPPEFRGAYTLKRSYTRTTLLSRENGIDDILEALQPLGENCWKVTLPLSDKPLIEFVGDYAGIAQDLLVVTVEQAPVGDLVFTLNLDRAELAAMLRREGPVTLPLEIRINGTDESGYTGEQLALSLDVKIQPPLIWPEMEEVPLLDLLRPYSPKTYVPFGAGNELVGSKYYQAVVGDGVVEEFVIATGLNSELVYIFGRENISGGRQLINGTDFSVTVDGDNQVTVTALTGAPATDAWMFVILSAESLPQWAADLTVTVPQVIAGGGYMSLPDYMDSTSERLEVLEAALPSISGLAAGTIKGTLEIELPTTAEVLFYRGTEEPFGEKGLDLTKLSARGPFMLPAVHDATVDDVTAVPASVTGNAGKVYKNNAAPDLLVATGGRVRPAGTVKQNEFFACDGRGFYKVTRDAATNSYYPEAFERELWMLFINDLQLRVGKTFEVQFGVQLTAALATSRAQWTLRIERGTAPQDSSPSPVGLNLQNIVWESTAMLEQRLILTPLATTHFFGVRIARAVAEITSDKMSYGTWEGNDANAPADANFALRARLVKFDTENSITTAVGNVAYKIVGGMTTDGSTSTEAPKALIY